MEEDPAFYEKFSKLIQQAIDDFKARRINDLEYLNQVTGIRNKVATKQHDEVPEQIRGNEEACAYYGVVSPFFMAYDLKPDQREAIVAETSLAIQEIIHRHWKVDFWNDADAQKAAMNDIDDFLYDQVKDQYGLSLSLAQMDDIIEKTVQIARRRRH
ncbi:hypothetical protein NOC27_1890 [Nitrosococcus oceani AFC27]|nr:hypothetical protein NOC27_1890 [Nitrosococcus oceani AFC27]GEM19313.1 hypothetical protein NONS58_06970 [Nitrosococcus oceani]